MQYGQHLENAALKIAKPHGGHKHPPLCNDDPTCHHISQRVVSPEYMSTVGMQIAEARGFHNR